jgi:hypothetical protein
MGKDLNYRPHIGGYIFGSHAFLSYSLSGLFDKITKTAFPIVVGIFLTSEVGISIIVKPPGEQAVF